MSCGGAGSVGGVQLLLELLLELVHSSLRRQGLRRARRAAGAATRKGLAIKHAQGHPELGAGHTGASTCRQPCPYVNQSCKTNPPRAATTTATAHTTTTATAHTRAHTHTWSKIAAKTVTDTRRAWAGGGGAANRLAAGPGSLA